MDDEQWNDVVANANASEGGDDEDGAAMASNSDYAAGESNLEYDRSFAVWICMAVSAVVYSVPFGFVRWNLSSLAPLVWWQLGLSTAVGTALLSASEVRVGPFPNPGRLCSQYKTDTFFHLS